MWCDWHEAVGAALLSRAPNFACHHDTSDTSICSQNTGAVTTVLFSLVCYHLSLPSPANTSPCAVPAAVPYSEILSVRYLPIKRYCLALTRQQRKVTEPAGTAAHMKCSRSVKHSMP
jgi:hypothetical protein